MNSSISLVGFPGGGTWPVWAGLQQGFFDSHRLDVRLEFTSSSVALFKYMMEGRYQIALTAFDNIVAYQEGQGEVLLPEAPDFFAFMGSDSGFLNLMASPDIPDIPGLKGKNVSVDAMTTGFAFVLREILARNDIGERDVQFEAVGGGAKRMTALLEGRQSATLLNSPLDLIAEAGGARRLLRAESAIGPYQGGVGMARQSWAQTNGAILHKFIRAYRDSVSWLYDRGNRAAAQSLLMENVSGINPAIASRAYEVMFAEAGGVSRDLGVDRRGMETVLALRSRFGRPRKTLVDPRRYVDLNYHAHA